MNRGRRARFRNSLRVTATIASAVFLLETFGSGPDVSSPDRSSASAWVLPVPRQRQLQPVAAKGGAMHPMVFPRQHYNVRRATAAALTTPERGTPRLHSPRLTAWIGGAAGAVWSGARRLTTHRMRTPAKCTKFPLAEIAFGLTVFGAVRAMIRDYHSALDRFTLRDELFQEMAIARTYATSIMPWIQTGVIAIIGSFAMVKSVKMLMRSMKEWEERQEIKEMSAMGQDALFLMSTPIDATLLEQSFSQVNRRRRFGIQRFVGWLTDRSQLLRVMACIGYLLPLLNVLDFGEMSISLYPYTMGVPMSEPIVSFMQDKLKLRYLHNAYLKSGNFFLIVWSFYIQLFVRNKAAPFFVRFHSSQAVLISMLLAVPQQIFFAVLNPWESSLLMQSFLYHSMLTMFLFTIALVGWCCAKALVKQQMQLPLVSEAAVMWAGRE